MTAPTSTGISVPAIGRLLPGRTSRRALGALATVTLSALLVLLAAVLVGAALGYRAIDVKSGSMTPALRVGDLIISKAVRPVSVRPGQIITFRDPFLDEQLVTHRVVSVRADGGVVHFVTKGDANTATEQWTIPTGGSLGRETLRVPQLGLWLSRAAGPVAWILAIGLAGLGVAWYLLQWVWTGTRPTRLWSRRAGPGPAGPDH